MGEPGPHPSDHTTDAYQRTTAQRLLRNAIYSSGSWILNVVVVMLATPFIVSKLGGEGYGIYALLTGLVGYYGLLDFGLGQGVTKYVAQFRASGDFDSIYRSINAALWVQGIAGFTGSVFVVICAGPILRLFEIPPELLASSRVSLYITACGFCFTMLSGTFSSVLMGLQMFKLLGKVNVALNIGLTLLIILALALGGGLLAVVALTAISALVIFFVYYIILRANLSGYRFSRSFDRTYLRTLASYSGYLFISKVSSTLGLYVVRFVVGYLLGPIGVTYFVIPSKVISAAGGFLSSASSVLFPYSSSLAVSKDLLSIQKTVVDTSKYLAALSIPMFLTLSFFSRFLMTIWMGAEFADHTWPILTLLSLGALLGSLTAIPNLVAMGLGYSRIVGLFSIASLSFNLVLIPLLTSLFGLVGTGWAIVISTFPGLFLVEFELRKVFHVNIIHYWNEALRIHLVPVMLAALLCQQWNKAGAMPSLVLSIFAVTVLCLYAGILVAKGYIPIAQWGRVFVGGKKESERESH